MELVIFLIAVWAVNRAWKDSKAAYQKSKTAYMGKAKKRFPDAPKSRRAATALRHDVGYWTSQVAGGFPAARHGFAAGWHTGRAAQATARTAREEARTQRLENQADHAERLSGFRARQQEALRRWRDAMNADSERETEGTVTGEGREGSGEGSPAGPTIRHIRTETDPDTGGPVDYISFDPPDGAEQAAPRVCVACGNPEYGPRRGGGNWGPLVTYTEPLFDDGPREPRLVHQSHFEDESSGFHGRPYEPAPAADGQPGEGGDCYLCGQPLTAGDDNDGVSHQRCDDMFARQRARYGEPPMADEHLGGQPGAAEAESRNGCDLCGLPLSAADGGNSSHMRCEEVYARDCDKREVTDGRDLEDVERDLRENGQCPWQIRANGWDGTARYCGQPLGGNEGDEFCPAHQAEADGDDYEAADELNAHVRALLEADEQESPASAKETSTQGENHMASDVTYDSVSASMTAEIAAADQRAAGQQQAAARASAMADQMQALEVDPATLSAIADHLDAHDAASKAQARVQETAAAVDATLRRGHAGLNEAHQNAPVQAADRGFYEG